MLLPLPYRDFKTKKATIPVSDGGLSANRYARPSSAAAEKENADDAYNDEFAG